MLYIFGAIEYKSFHSVKITRGNFNTAHSCQVFFLEMEFFPNVLLLRLREVISDVISLYAGIIGER